VVIGEEEMEGKGRKKEERKELEFAPLQSHRNIILLPRLLNCTLQCGLA